MVENPNSFNLTLGEDALLKLIDAIRAKSHANQLEGREDKEMDRWGEALVNSKEYRDVMEKVGKIRINAGLEAVEIDY